MDQLQKDLKQVEDYLGIKVYPKRVATLMNTSHSDKINAFRSRLPTIKKYVVKRRMCLDVANKIYNIKKTDELNIIINEYKDNVLPDGVDEEDVKDLTTKIKDMFSEDNIPILIKFYEDKINDFHNHYKNCNFYGASISDDIKEYYETKKKMKFKACTEVPLKNEFNELYRNIFTIESVERIEKIQYNEDNLKYIDYIDLYRKELKMLDCSVNTGRTPYNLSRKSFNNVHTSPKDAYNKLCHDFPIQEQYREIFKCVEEAYENVMESMKNDDIRRRYNRLNEFKIKLPPTQKQYDELEGIRKEITEFSDELSRIKPPDGYCNYKNEVESFQSKIDRVKRNIRESLSFLKDMFDRFENEKRISNEASENPTKYSDREYQEKIDRIKEEKEALSIFYGYYTSITQLLNTMKNIYPNSKKNKEFFPEHSNYLKKTTAEKIFKMNDKSYKSIYEEGNDINSLLRQRFEVINKIYREFEEMKKSFNHLKNQPIRILDWQDLPEKYAKLEDNINSLKSYSRITEQNLNQLYNDLLYLTKRVNEKEETIIKAINTKLESIKNLLLSVKNKLESNSSSIDTSVYVNICKEVKDWCDTHSTENTNYDEADVIQAKIKTTEKELRISIQISELRSEFDKLKNEVKQINDIDVKEYIFNIEDNERELNEMNVKTTTIKKCNECMERIEKINNDLHLYIKKIRDIKKDFDSLHSIYNEYDNQLKLCPNNYSLTDYRNLLEEMSQWIEKHTIYNCTSEEINKMIRRLKEKSETLPSEIDKLNEINDLITQIKFSISQLNNRIKENNKQYDLSDFEESFKRLYKSVGKLNVNKSDIDKCYELLSSIDDENEKLLSYLKDKDTISSIINSIEAVIISCESDLTEGRYKSLQSFEEKISTVSGWIKKNPLKSKTALSEYSKRSEEIERIRNEMDSQLDVLDHQNKIINKLNGMKKQEEYRDCVSFVEYVNIIIDKAGNINNLTEVTKLYNELPRCFNLHQQINNNLEKYKVLYNNLIKMMKKNKTSYTEIDNFYQEIVSKTNPFQFKTTALSQFIEVDQRFTIMLIKLNEKIDEYRYYLLNSIYTTQINVFTSDLKAVNKYSDDLLRFNSQLTMRQTTMSTMRRTISSLNVESLYSSLRIFNRLYIIWKSSFDEIVNNIQCLLSNSHSNYKIYSKYVSFSKDFQSALENYEEESIKLKAIADAKSLCSKIEMFDKTNTEIINEYINKSFNKVKNYENQFNKMAQQTPILKEYIENEIYCDYTIETPIDLLKQEDDLKNHEDILIKRRDEYYQNLEKTYKKFYKMNYNITNPIFDKDDFALSIKRCTSGYVNLLFKQSQTMNLIIREYLPVVNELFQIMKIDTSELFFSIYPRITKIWLVNCIDVVFEKYRSLCFCYKEKIELYKQIIILISEIDSKKAENNVIVRYSFGDEDFKNNLDKAVITMKNEDLRNLKKNFNRIVNMF